MDGYLWIIAAVLMVCCAALSLAGAAIMFRQGHRVPGVAFIIIGGLAAVNFGMVAAYHFVAAGG